MFRKVVIILLTLMVTNVQAQKTFLALGDSYTIGESVDESGRWPVQLSKQLNEGGYSVSKPIIIAKTGWRTDQLAAAIEDAQLEANFDIVGLLIGVNNQYQGKSVDSYKPEFERLLKTAIHLAGGIKAHVFVISIPDYGFTPFGLDKKEKISNELDAYNAANFALSKKAGVRYYNITNISRSNEANLVAADGLHPSAVQYGLWVDLLLSDPTFLEMLK
jgi:lysophospholipase L1-like esterase